MPATVLLDADAVAAHVARLGAEIERDHPDGVVLVGVLKGALIFVADLARAITAYPSSSTSCRSRGSRPTPGG